MESVNQNYPIGFERIADIIGIESTEMMCARLGGSSIYIPQIPNPNSRFVLAIGHANAAKLCNVFACKILHLPSRNSITRLARKNEIINDIKKGISVPEIAVKNGITVQHVRLIKRKETKNIIPSVF